MKPNYSSKTRRDQSEICSRPFLYFRTNAFHTWGSGFGLFESSFTIKTCHMSEGGEKSANLDYFSSVRPNYSSKRDETRRRFVPGPSYTSGRMHFIHRDLAMVLLCPLRTPTSSKLGQKSPNLDYFSSVGPNYSSKRDRARARGRFVPGPSFSSGRTHFIHGAMDLVCLSPFTPSKLPYE